MAGGLIQKQSNKKNRKSTGISTEILNNLFGQEPKQDKKSLNGVLKLNESVNLDNKSEKNKQQNPDEFIKNFINHLKEEQNILYSQKEQNIKKELVELQEEIKKLAKTTEDLDKSIEIATETNIVEYTEYQINFFTRLKKFIINLRKNIEEAGIWFESCNNKKKKRNCFWSNSQKGKNQQYMQSGEHSASRSAN